jgi:hypothetical protein
VKNAYEIAGRALLANLLPFRIQTSIKPEGGIALQNQHIKFTMICSDAISWKDPF